jgi:hypothetical protein
MTEIIPGPRRKSLSRELGHENLKADAAAGLPRIRIRIRDGIPKTRTGTGTRMEG